MANSNEQLIALINELKSKLDRQDKRIQELEVAIKGRSAAPAASAHATMLEQLKKPAVNPPRSQPSLSQKSAPTNWQAFELRIGQYWFQVVGIALFVLGMGFLLKYSIEQGWITPTARVVIGLVCATGLIAGAELLSRRFKQWALACTAGGIVLYYLCFVAAHILYHLISWQTTFIALGVTAVVGSVLAFRYNAQFISAFSAIGCFIIPFFVYRIVPESLQEMGGFITRPVIYLLEPPAIFVSCFLMLMALCFLVQTYIKQWYLVSAISFFSLITHYILFLKQPSLQPALSLNHQLLFMGGLFVLYVIVPYLYALLYKPTKSFFESVSIAIVAPCVFFGIAGIIGHYQALVVMYANQKITTAPAMYSWIVRMFESAGNTEIMQYLALIFGSIFCLSLVVLYFRDKANKYLLGTLFTLTIGFFAGAIVAQWSNYALTNAFHMYALIIFLLGLFVANMYVRLFAYFFWALSVINMWRIFFDTLFAVQEPWQLRIWDPVNISCLVVTVIFALGAYLAHKNKQLFEGDEGVMPSVLTLGALITVVYWLHTYIWKSPWSTIGLAWYGFIVFCVGLYAARSLFTRFGYFCVGLATTYFIFIHDTLLQGNYIAKLHILFFTLVTIFFVMHWLVQRRELGKNLEALSVALITKVAALLFVIAWGRALIVAHWNTVENGYLVWTANTDVILTMYYGIFAVILIAVGLFWRDSAVRYIGLALIAVVLGKLWFIIIAMRETISRILAFLLIGTLLTFVSFIYQRVSKKLGD